MFAYANTQTIDVKDTMTRQGCAYYNSDNCCSSCDEVTRLRFELSKAREKIVQQEAIIKSLLATQTDEGSSCTASTCATSDITTTFTCETSDITTNDEPKSSEACTMDNLDEAVELMQRWIFLEGGQIESAVDFTKKYLELLEQLGIPCDRLFYGGHMIFSGYVWKWERDHIDEVKGSELPRDVFDNRREIMGEDAPFIKLEDNQPYLRFVRIQPMIEKVPADCQWLVDDNYTDYVAFPFFHCGKFAGASAWCTRHKEGFTSQHIEFLDRTVSAFSTVAKFHTNERVRLNSIERMQVEIQDRTRDLEESNEKLKKANALIQVQSKKQLEHFASMSHEIRTPLNCIINLSDDLLRDEHRLDPSQRESVEMITRSGDVLLRVVNDVLEFSRLQSGHLDIDTNNNVNLLATLNTVVHAMRIKARDRGIDIKAMFHENLPTYVSTDPRRLQQIFFNLLGNAIKFSNENKAVEFTVSLKKDDEINNDDNKTNQESVIFVVKDYGRGIHRGDLESIFEPFNQASKDTQALFGGTGLGLSITKKIVEGLHGKIEVDSELGKWTEFTVTLKLPVMAMRRASGGLLGQDASTDMSTLYENLRVLVADDNLVNQKVLKRSLERLGVNHIEIVNNGKEAVDSILHNNQISTQKENHRQQEEQYDVVFMDADMPLMNGWEATKIIKEECRRCNSSDNTCPKIIFVTAHAASQYQEQAKEAGGDAFIAKPFKLKNIDTTIRSLFLKGN